MVPNRPDCVFSEETCLKIVDATQWRVALGLAHFRIGNENSENSKFKYSATVTQSKAPY